MTNQKSQSKAIASFSTSIITAIALVTSLSSVSKIVSNIKPVHAATPCIITISGIQYDVSPLLAPGSHAGGTSMFVCGTDLTSTFMSMPTHAADIARMSPYIYIAPTNTPSPTAVPTVLPTIIPTITPTSTPTVTPSVAPTSSPTVTPVPSTSVSPTPSIVDHDDDDELEEENESNEIDDHDEEKEDDHKSNSNSDHHKENESHHADEHRSPVSVVNSQKHKHND